MSPPENRDWEPRENEITPESAFRNRRALLTAMGIGGGLIAAGVGYNLLAEDEALPPPEPDPSAGLYPVPRNGRYKVDRPLTPELSATTYNNFYEFGSHKSIQRAAQKLPLRPWDVRIDGHVEKPFTIAIDDLLKRVALEERVYRFRCVEAWSMTVPWSGFPFRALVDLARPLSKAAYVRMETFHKPDIAGGQKQGWYPWPYIEGLTMAEATNELAFLATGIYGRPLPKQNGTPLRLVVPWKYGFKSIKSIVRFTFTDQRPKTFWETVAPAEYGFWANVNPEVPHRRWSQARERVLGGAGRRPTLLYNGYEEQVAGLYKDMKGERLFA
jgi:sulfoxide reductase catalytic subunit YedY